MSAVSSLLTCIEIAVLGALVQRAVDGIYDWPRPPVDGRYQMPSAEDDNHLTSVEVRS